MYTGSEYVVRTSYGFRDWFLINAGVKQGGMSSPLIFIIYKDKGIWEVNMWKELRMVLACANDIAK